MTKAIVKISENNECLDSDMKQIPLQHKCMRLKYFRQFINNKNLLMVIYMESKYSVYYVDRREVKCALKTIRSVFTKSL
jgi:hypothetical protein